jgi:hypothetical protein
MCAVRRYTRILLAATAGAVAIPVAVGLGQTGACYYAPLFSALTFLRRQR